MIARKRPAEATYSGSLFDQGIGHVAIARFKLSGEVEVGVFLLDVFCLGVKNAFFTRVSEDEYDGHLLERLYGEAARVSITPACARKLVEEAVAYAEKWGLPPHPDYRKACRVWGGIDPKACDQSFTFGKDGKPFYIQGPNDTPTYATHVLRQLNHHCGAGNFDYLVLAGTSM